MTDRSRGYYAPLHIMNCKLGRLFLVAAGSGLLWAGSGQVVAREAGLQLPSGVTMASATPAQLREATTRTIRSVGPERARQIIPPLFRQLDCKEMQKAAAIVEGYLDAAPEDAEYLVRHASSVQPCFASLVAATAAGFLPDQAEAIAAAAKAGVSDYLGPKNARSVDSLIDSDPAMAGATERSIDLAVASGVRNGRVDDWLWQMVASRPFFAMDGSINPGAVAGSRSEGDGADSAARRRPRRPRGNEVSPPVGPPFTPPGPPPTTPPVSQG